LPRLADRGHAQPLPGLPGSDYDADLPLFGWRRTDIHPPLMHFDINGGVVDDALPGFRH